MSELAEPMPAAADDLAAAPATAALRAQAVRCGGRRLAFDQGWARAALERADISAVPGAPAWLAGAVNVDGQIVPVIDLAAWLDRGAWTDTADPQVRLLLGGHGEDTAAFLFEGLPRLVRVQPGAMPLAHGDPLAPFARGSAEGDLDAIAIDAAALFDALIDSLAH